MLQKLDTLKDLIIARSFVTGLSVHFIAFMFYWGIF